MGEKIAYLGVDRRVSTETILRAAALARHALGEETPAEFFVWIQRAESANRVRWFGLHAVLQCDVFAPSDNLVRVATFSAMLARHDLREMRIPDRPGVPGESRPTITLFSAFRPIVVSKWSNDRQPDFDALMHWLRSAADHVSKSVAPLWTGPYDWHWRPL